MKKDNSLTSTIVMFLIFTSVLTAFLGAYGTGDRQFFMGWIDNAMQYGVRVGFGENHDMYPPFAPLILYVAKCIFGSVPDSSLFAIRISTAVFMLISCIVAKALFKSNKICYLLFFSMVVSVTNGFLDIFIVPFALLAFYYARKENYFLTGLFLSLMCLMKYQPLIIMPIVVAGFIHVGINHKRINITWDKIGRMVIGGIIPLIPVTLFYRKMFFKSIYVALFRDSGNIAPNGLNLGWIIQYFYELSTGGLNNGMAGIMWSVPNKAMLSFKLIFVLGYLFVFVRTLIADNKSLAYVLKNSLSVYILYYLFSVNVHENHFFCGVLLALLLYIELGEKYNQIFYACAYMFNINLLIFYGIWGGAEGFFRVIGGVFDPTILLAIVNVIIGMIILRDLVFASGFDDEGTKTKSLV
ncbi:hypothetical protein [Butyrivibrio fibrisolvens]|uniref:hypothetical protein n=1 Tax=Butyrivibrio fibrisolvens TaxID=831 RepID=UPI0003B35710|nr:hypothetical protein [Butyrivibrio fibrisolvens]